MDNPQDCSVTSSQDVIKQTCPSTSEHSATIYQNRNGRKKKIKSGTEQFPWFLSFQKLSRSVLGSNSMKDLLNVITVYTEHVSRDVVASYSKPNRAAKLKTNMISMLGFFHNCYITMKEPFDEAAYLEKMSDLLTMYFDMEVKASRRGKESVKRITSKLISALFIILNNSSVYILDTILKARFTVKSYSEICIPIFKMVTHLPQSQEMNYVRCLLVFKLWKRMLPCREERNSINRLAVAKLSPAPAQVMEFVKRGLLTNVLPTPPEDKKAPLVTRFYMTKKFNLRESIKAFLKMEAELKLNDFTSALDSIKFLDDEEDVMPVENTFEKDYSLLESIWIDISNSPETPDQSSLSSPSTSGSSPLDNISGTSRVLELSKTTPRKVKKSLFKPKSAKKNKQLKIKSKDKTKKKKEDLVIDLCKENEDNSSDTTQIASENLNTCSNDTSESQAFEKVSPTSTSLDGLATNVKSDASFSLESIPEVNSSEDLKLSCKLIEKNVVKSNIEVESKLVVKNQVKTEASFVSKPKHLGSVSKPRVGDSLAPSTTVSDFSTNILLEATIAPQNVPELNSKESFKFNCNSNEKNQEKVMIDEEANVKHESIGNVFVKTNEISDVPLESDDMKTESEKEENLDTASMEVAEEEPPVNKIVISCKNFSKIGFKHEEIEENSVKSISEESEELLSTIEVNEDPILKTESLKEDSLLFKDDELSSEKLSLDQLEQGLDAEELRWDSTLKVDSLGIKLSANEVVSISKDMCSNDFRNTRFNLNTEISHSSKPNIVKDFFHEKITNANQNKPNKRIEPVDHVLPQTALPSEDSINRFGGQMYTLQNYLQESIKSNQINNTKGIKTVVNSEIGGQSLDINLNLANKPQVETPLASEVIPEVTGIVQLKSGTKIIHKSISTIIHDLKEGESSTSSDNSNQESSEVSSSSFDDSYQMKSSCTSNLKINPLVEKPESKSCKVEQKHFKEFSACMQNFEHSLVKSQFKEKCDKNTQVPSEKSGYVISKSNFIAGSQNSLIPKNDKLKQAFNLHKGLNTCLLHKILGEEDCLKNGCLLKNSAPDKFPQDLNERGFPGVSLKQELENSSELPSENSTPTISSLWKPVAGIKVEKDHENRRNSECIDGIRNTSSEFFVRSVTEACNFKELDYNIGNECDNLTAGYDCESDCEDRNLVIDEDIDSIKDHNETEDIQLKYGTDHVQNDAGNNTVSPVILTNIHKHSKQMDQQIWDKDVSCEILNVAIDHQAESPGLNNKQTKENESLRKELSGKHKLPRILENNIKTSSLRNVYINETSVDSSVKYRPLGNNDVLFTAENSAPYISTQRYGAEISNIVPKHYTQPKIVKRSDGSVNIGQISPSCRVFSPYPTPNGKNPSSIRTKNRDPRLGPVTGNNTYHLKSNVNIQSANVQSNQIKSLESLGSVNQPILSSEIAKAASPSLVPSPSHYETYTQYNMGNQLSVPSNQSSGSPVERFCPRNPVGNDKYRSLEKLRQKRESPVSKFQENPNNASHTNLGTYAEGSNVKDPSFHKYSATESNKIKAGEPLYDNVNSKRDPLCLVKNKEDLRETYDFEFNVFPIAQEVEICSGSENVGVEWLYPLSSEIGHPDWPIANEQNVIDSSGYTQNPDQYMYSLLKNDEGSAIAEADQPCYMPLELQQIDNRHPNLVGKNINKKLNLHLRTLEGDYNLCCSQSEFKEFYLSRDVPPTIPVPFPPQGRSDSLSSTVRCPCEQCSDNFQKLLSNYNVLTHFRNSKIKPLGVFPKSDEASFSEKDPNGEFDSSLPLKKRKTLTNSKATDDLVLPSYPNTPMISIAQLELTGYEQGNQVIVPNPQSQWRDSVAYNPLNLVQPPSTEPFDGQTKGKRKASKRRKSSR